MSKKKKISKVAERVEWLLRKKPSTRDDDNVLVTHYWYHQAVKNYNDNCHALYLLDEIKRGELDSWDSITRARRKLQEKHPELRGRVWNERHAREDEVIEDLKNIK